jgi:very-short-patch-repair endonuclease
VSDVAHSKSASGHMRERARELRANATSPERILWGMLRDRRFAGVKFRRQHPIGPYVVDFYCPSHGLVVELDGMSHDDRGISDHERQQYLENVARVRVFRVSNDDILGDRESVIYGLLRTLGFEVR